MIHTHTALGLAGYSALPFQLHPSPTKTSYNVILFVIVGNVLPEGPNDNHAQDA